MFQEPHQGLSLRSAPPLPRAAAAIVDAARVSCPCCSSVRERDAPATAAGTAALHTARVELLWCFRRFRFRSACMSAALWYRASRSFSSALSMISSSRDGSFGLSRKGGTGLSLRMAVMVSAPLPPAKGCRHFVEHHTK